MPMINSAAAHEHRTMFQVSVDRLKLILKTEQVDSKEAFCGLLRRTVDLIGDFQWAVEGTSSPAEYHQSHLMLISSLQHVYEAARQFHGGQDLSGFEYVDLLSAVEFAERAMPRLYLSVLAAAVLLDRWHADGRMGTDLVASPKELLADLACNFSALKAPLKGINLWIFSIVMLSPHLEKVEADAAGQFLGRAFQEIAGLWIRYGQIGDLMQFETRQKQRAEMLDLVMAPIKTLVNLPTMTTEIYAEQVCPVVMKVLLESDDGLCQSDVFLALLETLPPAYHLASLDCLLSTIRAFEKLDNERILTTLTGLILGVTEDPKGFWGKIRPILAVSSASFRYESDLIRLVALFIAKAREPPFMEDLMAFLLDHVTDKENGTWTGLFKELAATAEHIQVLLGSPTFVKCVCRNTLKDLETSVALVERAIEEESTGQGIADLLAAIYTPETIEENETSFLSKVQNVTNVPSNLFALLLEGSLENEANLALNYLMFPMGQDLLAAHDDSILGKLELFRDSKRSSVDSPDISLQEYFSADGPAYQFTQLMLRMAISAVADDSLLYLYLSKALLTVEKNFDSSGLQYRAVMETIYVLEEALKGLKAQDVEVLLTSLGKTASRQLDIKYRARSLLGLLRVLISSGSDELVDNLIIKAMDAVKGMQKERGECGLELMDVSTALLKAKPEGVLRASGQLNSFFWDLRDACSFDLKMRYNELWAEWSELLPSSRIIQAAQLVEEEGEEGFASPLRSPVLDDADDPSDHVPALNAMMTFSLEDEENPF